MTLHIVKKRAFAGVAFETQCGLPVQHDRIASSPELATCRRCKRVREAAGRSIESVRRYVEATRLTAAEYLDGAELCVHGTPVSQRCGDCAADRAFR